MAFEEYAFERSWYITPRLNVNRQLDVTSKVLDIYKYQTTHIDMQTVEDNCITQVEEVSKKVIKTIESFQRKGAFGVTCS